MEDGMDSDASIVCWFAPSSNSGLLGCVFARQVWHWPSLRFEYVNLSAGGARQFDNPVDVTFRRNTAHEAFARIDVSGWVSGSQGWEGVLYLAWLHFIC